jgi:hypothetical protein
MLLKLVYTIERLARALDESFILITSLDIDS